jgi:acetyltransferase-like isoleucine patch superfamily enzyme
MYFSDIKQFFKEKFYLVPGVIGSLILNMLPSSRLRVSFINNFFSNSRVDKTVTIHRGLKVLMMRNLFIGKGSTVNSKCFLDTRNTISIGTNVMLGHATKIYSLGHDYECKNFSAKGGNVSISDNVIIFSDVRIMPNIKIGYGAVVMPSSVVIKDIIDLSVVGGNPAKFIKKREKIHEKPFNYRSVFGL